MREKGRHMFDEEVWQKVRRPLQIFAGTAAAFWAIVTIIGMSIVIPSETINSLPSDVAYLCSP